VIGSLALPGLAAAPSCDAPSSEEGQRNEREGAWSAGGTPALGGIAESPVLTLGGQTAQRLYSMPGVGNANNLATLFTCVNAS
jgi:hypothetical protein